MNYTEHTNVLIVDLFPLKQPLWSGQGWILQCICVFHLHSLDLWRLDNRGLCSLNDPMDLNRLSVWELHQCYRWTCCRHLKFRRNVIELPRNTDVKPLQTGNQFIVGSLKWSCCFDAVRHVTCARAAICAGVICWLTGSVTAVSAPCWASSTADSIFICSARAEDFEQICQKWPFVTLCPQQCFFSSDAKMKAKMCCSTVSSQGCVTSAGYSECAQRSGAEKV